MFSIRSVPGSVMPLRYLFVDMNAYFASCEQQDHPQYRGRPIAVVPVKAETGCCIAASYEAKAKGVKTGTPVWQARQVCPGIQLVIARPERYVQFHKLIVKAVGRCVPVKSVMSIDEMSCGLIGDERKPENAEAIARNIKREIFESAGEWMRCSIGIGPNVMLAKVAGDMKKPNGLTILGDTDRNERLCTLKLTDFPGIGPRMEKRFHRAGITSTRQLLGMTAAQLSRVWGSRVHGERWWYLLRGEDVPDVPTRRRTVGHSHVLPPALRTEEGARGVMVRLIHKAAARLRGLDHWTSRLGVGVVYLDRPAWEASCHLPQCQDTLNILLAFGRMWEAKPFTRGTPMQVRMVLSDLTPTRNAKPSLYEQDRQLTVLSHTMDRINTVFGRNAIHFGALFGAEDSAPVRIGFTNIPEFNPAFM
jgi:DNA polymerase-4